MAESFKMIEGERILYRTNGRGAVTGLGNPNEVKTLYNAMIERVLADIDRETNDPAITNAFRAVYEPLRHDSLREFLALELPKLFHFSAAKSSTLAKAIASRRSRGSNLPAQRCRVDCATSWLGSIAQNRSPGCVGARGPITIVLPMRCWRLHAPSPTGPASGCRGDSTLAQPAFPTKQCMRSISRRICPKVLLIPDTYKCWDFRWTYAGRSALFNDTARSSRRRTQSRRMFWRWINQ